MPFEGQTGETLRKAVLGVVVVLGLFLIVQAFSGVMQLRYIGAGLAAANTISVGGHGEVLSVPNIATFTFSVVAEKPTVEAAQTQATAIANATTQYLKDAGIDAKDIQTSEYSIYPQYDYVTQACPAGSTYCPGGKQTLRGYQVRQSTTVKVRATASAGTILAGVGTKGATEVSGLNFTIDDPTAVSAEARDKAIADAKEKAEKLAHSLGVSLVRVVSFNESSGGTTAPRPMYTMSGAADVKAVAPEISVGQNQITSDVVITYEIR